MAQTQPGHDCKNNGAIYATVDVSKKKKHAEPPTPPTSNYMNLEPTATTAGGKQTAMQAVMARNGRKATDNYMNLEFSESLCHYENAKNVLTKAGLVNNACDKCGHRKRCAENGTGDDGKSDYMTMEPVNGRMVEACKRNPFPGYLPMCPAAGGAGNNKQQGKLKDIINKGLAEKSASIPSLNECNRSSVMVDGVPVNKNLIRVDEPRKRSSSAGSSSRYDDEREPVVSGGGEDPQSSGRGVASNLTSSAESMTSQIAKCPNSTAVVAESTASVVSDGSGTITTNSSITGKEDQQTALVHIRRSSSVPCKNNRDSSSSNDSGVSTGSLRYRGADFAEFELPLTTAMSTMRHRRTMAAVDNDAVSTGCVHGSLPRRSKSTDRLKELSFRFQRFVGPMKSSSAGAEVPVCLKKDKGQYYSIYPNIVFGPTRIFFFFAFSPNILGRPLPPSSQLSLNSISRNFFCTYEYTVTPAHFT